MTAINETFGDQWFTSSTIITRKSFNLSSSNLTYEVRATLPTDEGVFGVIVLIPEENPFENVMGNGFFILMNYPRTIQAGYIHPAKATLFKFIATLQEMSEFSKSYTRLEISNASALQTWSFSGELDSSRKFSYNSNCSGQMCKTLFNQAKYKLAISVIVTPRLVGRNVQEVIRKSKSWYCSSLIIDYVKIYELDHSENVNNIQLLNKSHEIRASDICHHVSSDLGRKPIPKVSKTIISGIPVIYICLAILLLIMTLVIVIWLVFMRKKKTTEQAPNEEIYDDNFDKEEVYEEINHSNQYENVNYEQHQTGHEYLQIK